MSATAGKITLELMTPERLLVREEVDEVFAPGSQGDFGVRPGHCYFMTTLKIGELRYRQGDQWHYFSVIWGYAQVRPDHVAVLAELSEPAHEIDLGRAEAEAEEAKSLLAASKKRDELDAARRRLEKAMLRIRTGRRKR
jgi:F-type H+-transporting ATPase subunit epsilon